MPLAEHLWRACPFLLLTLMFVPSLCTSLFSKTQWKLNDSAALSCESPCAGVTQWSRYAEVVAECGPGAKSDLKFTCTSNMGQTTLNIPQVNFSTRGLYSFRCHGQTESHCQQFLKLLPPEFTLPLDAGEHLQVDLQIDQPVAIMFTSPGSSSPVQLCSVDGRHVECLPEYQSRVLIVKNTFVLGSVAPSDRGDYAVQEKDGTPVSISHVTVNGKGSSGTEIPSAQESKKPDYKHIFISTVNDVQQSWIWRDAYRKGNEDGYQRGLGIGAVGFGTVAMALGVIFGMFVGPHLRPLLVRCIQTFWREGLLGYHQAAHVIRDPAPAVINV